MSAVELEVKDALERIREQVKEPLDNLDARLRDVEQKAARRGSPLASESSSDAVSAAVLGHVDLARLREGNLKSLRIPVGAFSLGQKSTITSADFPGVPQRDPMIYGPLRRPAAVRDLLVVRPTTASSIDYLKGSRTGTAGVQAVEGTVKADLDLALELVNAKVATIAVWTGASRQVLEDDSSLADFIDGELRDALRIEEDGQLLFGSGIGANLAGMFTQATAYDRAAAGDTPIDTIRRALTQVQLARGVPSGIVISPVGLELLELQKDGEDRYVMPFTVADGNGRATVWRVPAVVTDVLDDADFLVGDFGRAARLWDRRQATVEVATQHADYFVRNLVAILAEERLALTIPRPDLLVKGSFS